MVITEYVEADAFVVIGGLVVDREYRKQGIGRRLLVRAEEWAAQHGCSVVRLTSNVKRIDAHAFYERVGYTNLKTQYSFAKSLGPAGPGALGHHLFAEFTAAALRAQRAQQLASCPILARDHGVFAAGNGP